MMRELFQKLRRRRQAPQRRGASPVMAFARRLPYGYTFALLLFALLGHGFILLFPLTALALATAIPALIARAATPADLILLLLDISLLLLTLGVTLAMARLRPEPPADPLLEPDQATALYEEIDELAELLDSGRPDTVRLRAHHRIELLRTPRSGFPYPRSKHLVIGTLTLQSLAPPHIRALLARRLVRLSWRHLHVHCWLQELIEVWEAYARTYIHKPGPANTLLLLFFGWYSPLYRRLARPAVRLAEQALDQAALAVINDLDMAETVALSALTERFLSNRFWPRFFDLARHRETPPLNPYSQLEKVLGKMHSDGETELWLKACYPGELDDRSDTPRLARRLDRIGYHRLPEIKPPEQFSTAPYLGEHAAAIIDAMGKRWSEENAGQWQRIHEQHLREQQAIDKLQAKDNKKPLSPKALEQYTVLVERQLGIRHALPLFKRLLAQRPDDATLHFRLGEKLLAVNEKVGRHLLAKAMRLDKQFEPHVLRLLSLQRRLRPLQRRAG